MGKALIIVESPAKIKTLKKFLARDYIFESSVGHIRDLPEREFGIDIEHDFEPKYTILPNKEEVINGCAKLPNNAMLSTSLPIPTAKEKQLPGISLKSFRQN